jgi:hypothetical protein
MAITPEQHAAGLANLYPEAVAAIAGWAPGRLEARAAQPHSSQALCVSVFVTFTRGRGARRRPGPLKPLA